MHSAWDDLSILTALVHNPIKVPLPCCAAAWPTRLVPRERRQRKSAGDAMRRGRPALWKAYGTGPAVLAGDALFALAVETVSIDPPAVRRLTAALGDLVHGQADDLLFGRRPWTGPDAVTVGEYERMAEHKTGALLGCALALGAHFGGACEKTASALDRTGRHLGVAFQIADDLLGIWGDPEVTGKPVHGDLRQGKKTLPILAALGTPYGTELAGLLAARDDMAVRRAAALVAEAGGACDRPARGAPPSRSGRGPPGLRPLAPAALRRAAGPARRPDPAHGLTPMPPARRCPGRR